VDIENLERENKWETKQPKNEVVRWLRLEAWSGVEQERPMSKKKRRKKKKTKHVHNFLKIKNKTKQNKKDAVAFGCFIMKAKEKHFHRAVKSRLFTPTHFCLVWSMPILHLV
jgi:hypothetical protein